jgi:AcrR family transcriptional regulator
LGNDLNNGRTEGRLGHCPNIFFMKEKLPLEDRIVQTALKMFNESGIEYVGMRELAAALDIRIGNLTYYFPTKDDLVNRLAIDLAEENNRTIVPIEDMTMERFFGVLDQVFRNHLKFRCLMLSFVHVMQRNPLISKRYSKIQSKRNETWAKNIEALRAAKYLKATDAEIDFLVSTIALIARFWISEAAIAFRNVSEEDQMRHYIKMIARIFEPYATAKGKKNLDTILGATIG